MEGFSVRALQLLLEPKRGSKELEGELRTITLKSPDVVVITDEEAVPNEYKRAILTLDLDDLLRVLDECLWLVELAPKREIEVMPSACKKALEDGLEVAGADLVPHYAVGIK